MIRGLEIALFAVAAIVLLVLVYVAWRPVFKTFDPHRVGKFDMRVPVSEARR